LIEQPPAVVFVTAYDKYAIKAFEVHAVDYLLKPFDDRRLHQAIERARQLTGQPAVPVHQIAAAARSPQQYLERLVVKDGSAIYVVRVDHLDYVKAEDDYVALRAGSKNLLKQQTIASLEECLDPARFVRIHRSYIVNLERVARIEPYGKDSKVVVLKDGTTLPVSRTGYARLKELLGHE
jgi:two-component system LytT family response regulator